MIWVQGSTPGTLEICDCVMDYAYDKAIYVDGTQAPNIHDNTIRNSAWGVYLATSGLPAIQNNTFTDVSTPVCLGGADATFTGNQYTGSGNKMVGVGGTLVSNTVWEDLGVPYLVASDLTVPAGKTLTINAGVVVKFQAVNPGDGYNNGIELNVYGTLNLQGTAGQKVVFTSSRDDTYGGDSNGDGAGSSPEAGNWGAIHYYNPANVLHDAVVRYGGLGSRSSYSSSDTQMIWVQGSTGNGHLIVKRCLLQYAYQTGVYVQPTGPNLTEIVWGNTFDYCPVGIKYDGGTSASVSGQINGNLFEHCSTAIMVDRVNTSLAVHYNRFNTVSTYGVQSTDPTKTVDARQNWWGSATGPGPVGPGSGAPVSAYVDYSNWWTSDSQSPQPQGVWNVLAQRRGDSRLVDIYYDIAGDSGTSYQVNIAVSTTGGEPYTIRPSTRSLSGAVGTGILPEFGHHILWDANADGFSGYTDKMRIKVTADLE